MYLFIYFFNKKISGDSIPLTQKKKVLKGTRISFLRDAFLLRSLTHSKLIDRMAAHAKKKKIIINKKKKTFWGKI